MFDITKLAATETSIVELVGGDDAPLRTVEAAAILFTVLLAFMEIRHAVNNGDGMETGVFQGGFFLPNKFSYAYAIPTMPSSEPICDLDTLR